MPQGISDDGKVILKSISGPTILEGTLADAAQGPGNFVSFTLENQRVGNGALFAQIEPLTGSYQDFWSVARNPGAIDGPSDGSDMARIVFFDNGAATFSFQINADNTREDDEVFRLAVYGSFIGPVFGDAPIVTYEFTIRDDDAPARPVARDDAYVTVSDATLAMKAAAGVLANDTDRNFDTMTATLISSVSNGILTFVPNGSFTYVPIKGFSGTDSFVYRVSDGTLDGARDATVVLTVAPAGPTAGNDVLDGTEGNDQIALLAGDDFYRGLAGDDNIAGGDGNDTLYGGAGDDTIDGGAGGDVLVGGDGSDRFIVDNANDRVFESRAGTGTDVVISSVDFRMGRQHIENLDLTGDARLGAGNGLMNLIRGTAGDNILDGGKNVDTLVGGLGDDTYLIRAPGDNAIERAGEGTDTVKAFRAYELDANIENLFLQTLRNAAGEGVAGVNGIGNDLDNTIVGNPFDNVIAGREGDDTLRGQAGADTFVFDRGFGEGNVDTIVDFNTNAAAEGDILRFTQAVAPSIVRGQLAEAQFVAGTMAGDADDRFIFDQRSGQLWFDADGAGGTDQVLVALFERNATVEAHDIFLV